MGGLSAQLLTAKFRVRIPAREPTRCARSDAKRPRQSFAADAVRPQRNCPHADAVQGHDGELGRSRRAAELPLESNIMLTFGLASGFVLLMVVGACGSPSTSKSVVASAPSSSPTPAAAPITTPTP